MLNIFFLIKVMNSCQILEKYSCGHRDFKNASLCNLSFINEDLSGADLSNSNLTGTSFLDCKLDHTRFKNVKTGQPPVIRLLLVCCFIILVFFSAFLAAFFAVYASSTRISKVVLILSCFLLYYSFDNPSVGYIPLSKRVPLSIKILFLLIFAVILFGGLRMQSPNDGLGFLFSSLFLSFSVLMQVISNSLARILCTFLNADILRVERIRKIFNGCIISGLATVLSAILVIYNAPNRIGIPNNIMFVSFSILVSALLISINYDSVLIAFLSRILSIQNTSFKGSSLKSADFSFTSLAGVDFQDAMLESVCWAYTKNLDLALFSHAIPQKESPQMDQSQQSYLLQKHFDVALSFPGECRSFVSEVASILKDRSKEVFYDEYFEAELAQSNLDIILQKIYHENSDLIVVFLSKEYDRKEWCKIEWRFIRDLQKRGNGSSIMFMRFDEAPMPGFLSIDGYIDLRQRSPTDAVNLICERIKIQKDQVLDPE